jgi:hypothetical protein
MNEKRKRKSIQTENVPSDTFAYHMNDSRTATPLYASSFLVADIPPYAPKPELLSLYDDSIYRVSNVLTGQECRDAIAFAKQLGFTRVQQAQTSDFAFRDNDRVLIQSPQLASLLWSRLQPHVVKIATSARSIDLAQAVGCNPALRFYRYRTGQSFGCHVDQSIVDLNSGWVSRYTVLIYLNDSRDSNLVGGHTLFYTSTATLSTRQKKKKTMATKEEHKPVLDVAPITGMALMHGHGEHCLEHEGQRVDRGEKFVLRTDVMFQAS